MEIYTRVRGFISFGDTNWVVVVIVAKTQRYFQESTANYGSTSGHTDLGDDKRLKELRKRKHKCRCA